MSIRRRNTNFRHPHGFTLLEILAATAMFSVIIGALCSVFFTALRLRERSYEQIEKNLPHDYVLRIMRHDFSNTAPPIGILAGPFLGDKIEEGETRLDQVELYTASGSVNDDAPWGDVQHVAYYLDDSEESGGYDLVRAVKRNLLEMVVEEPEEEVLLQKIESFTLEYHDGYMWRDEWDSTVEENALPRAVGIEIAFLPEESGGIALPPIEAVILLSAQSPQTGNGREEGEGQK